MKDNFSEKDSLQLIEGMIAQVRNNVQKGAGNLMILWGCSITVISIACFFLFHILNDPYQANYLWWLCVPLTFISFFIGKKQDKKALVKTHIDTIIHYIWSAFLVANSLILISIFAYSYMYESNIFMILITPSILILLGFAQLITGACIKEKIFKWGAIVFWISALLILALSYTIGRSDVHMLILALAMFFGMAVPGIKLNKKYKG